MGKITVQLPTTKNPITLIGMEAGICYGSNTTDDNKNFKRGLDCLATNHGRTLEFPQIYLTIDGYSARVIRELYTHTAGAPTRVQASTRYINYGDFDYIVPPSIDVNPNAAQKYDWLMYQISETFKDLQEMGIPKEDIANILPLGMETKMVLRTNLRNLIDMSHQRMCTRAYWEYRQLMKDICNALSEYSDEWKYIVDTYFMPKCEVCGFCTEAKSCGRKPKKAD
jgi:thymidylate synthase (FAD)